MTSRDDALLQAVAARFCVGNRHEGFVSNCPVCLARYLRLYALWYGPEDGLHDDRHDEEEARVDANADSSDSPTAKTNQPMPSAKR